MNIITELTTGNIIQVAPSGTSTVDISGKFIPAIPDIAPVTVTGGSYVLPVDGGDVTSQAFSNLLAQFPMYGNALFNPLLTAGDMANLDLAATYGPLATRAAVGRAVGPLPVGQSPNRTKVLRRNPVTLAPGVLVTDTIDVSALVPAGIDEVLVWWKLGLVVRTQDVTSDFGSTAGENTPCSVQLGAVPPEPAGFSVYASNDDGVTWYNAGYLVPTDLINLGTLVRLAFVNTSPSFDRNLLGFGFLF